MALWTCPTRCLRYSQGMSDTPFQIQYSQSFTALEEILSQVTRPGDFHAAGELETVMPALRIEGVGLLSFPVPAAQAQEIIRVAAERAPYGKGAQTLHQGGPQFVARRFACNQKEI